VFHTRPARFGTAENTTHSAAERIIICASGPGTRKPRAHHRYPATNPARCEVTLTLSRCGFAARATRGNPLRSLRLRCLLLPEHDRSRCQRVKAPDRNAGFDRRDITPTAPMIASNQLAPLLGGPPRAQASPEEKWLVATNLGPSRDSSQTRHPDSVHLSRLLLTGPGWIEHRED